MKIEQIRTLFEQLFPMPSTCTWCGKSYAATAYNAWEADKYAQKFEGFRAAIEWRDRQDSDQSSESVSHEKIMNFPDRLSTQMRMAENAAAEASKISQLRDQFAGQWLSGLGAYPFNFDSIDETASVCYRMADAMLKAREKRGE